MLSYHPSSDWYHAAFRFLVLVRFGTDIQYEVEKLRLVDFYFLYPGCLHKINLPAVPKRVVQRKFGVNLNPYHDPDDHRVAFQQMLLPQTTALRFLVGNRSLLFERGRVILGEMLTPSLAERASVRSEENAELLEFLTGTLAKFPLQGKKGLKAMTDLMDYRHDSQS